jgi:thiol-disulfide isomerase/thioredoxin
VPVIGALTLVARLVLAAVFAVAAVAKLRDRCGTRQAVVEFGAPEGLAGPLALALPLAELIVAGLLLSPETALAGAMGALALLLLFTLAVAASLARGKSPDCHCFGQLHSAPASWKTLVRNGALLAVALFALVGSVVEEPLSAVAWIGELGAAEVITLVIAATASVVLAVGGLAFMALMRSYGIVLVRLDRVEAALARAGLSLEDDLEMPEIGHAPGTPAPTFEARTIEGEDVSLETLVSSGVASLLLFTSPHCGPCKTLMPAVAEWQREYAERLTIVIASSGSASEVHAETDEYGLGNVVVDEGDRLAELFEANGTPSAVLVSADGTIGSWVVSGAEWVGQLVGQALGGEEDEGLPVGTEVPAIELTSLDGETVSLATLHGRDSLLLFWNPNCGFCRHMHDDVLSWEASSNGIHPQLVIVSSGAAESTRAEGFRSLVLVDEQYTAGEAFGANGTPMAVLIDADGRIASPVVAGAEAVLALAGTAVPA